LCGIVLLPILPAEDVFGHAVAHDVPTDIGHAEAEPGREPLEEEGAASTKGGHRADATRQLSHEQARARFADAHHGPRELVDPARDLESERRR
jgi:hypothetical protein